MASAPFEDTAVIPRPNAARRRCPPPAALALLAALLLASPRIAATPTAPSEPSRPNAVQLDLGLAVIGLAYERVLADTIALQLELQIFGTWFGPYFDYPNLSGFGAQIRSSVFPFGHAPRGLYIAPFVRANRVTGEANGEMGSAVGASYGAFLGYSFLFWQRWNVRVGAGAQYMSYAVDAGATRLEMRTFFPALDLVAGVRF